MSDEIRTAIDQMRTMGVADLRKRYQEVFGEETKSGNRPFLFKRIAFRLQEQKEGGLSKEAQEKLAELAPLAPIRRGTAASKKQVPDSPARAQKKRAKAVTPKTEKKGRDPRLPAPGKILVREFDGKKHTVKVHADGFEYRGKTYRSLSGVAKVISGCIWNGYGFFGLLEKK